MSLENSLKKKYKEQLEKVDDVEELILDEFINTNQIAESDKVYLERFIGLSILSMNYLGLTSVENFPEIPFLLEVNFEI